MAGQCAVTNQSGKRLPGLCRQADHSGRKRFGQPVSPTGRSMASGQKRRPEAGECLTQQQSKGLVALSPGPRVEGHGDLQEQGGGGVSLLRRRKVWPGFNDLETVEPKVAAQWHPTLNGQLTPRMVTAGSRRKVWWQCPEGHVWNGRLLQGWKTKVRLSGLCRTDQRSADEGIPAHGGEQQGKTER